MADTRINALTTATSSASDDFLPIDGTTNGTKKLSAYSPSFGGNATVGGTLTVNGASLSTAGQISSTATSALLASQIYIYNGSASATNAALSGSQFLAQPGYSTFVGTTGDGTNASYQSSILGSVVLSTMGYVISNAANGLLLHGINGGIRFAAGNPGTQYGTINNSGVWNISTTTDSTTKDTGCLVLEGGLGVEKNAVLGGTLTVNGTAGITIGGSSGSRLKFTGVSGGWDNGINFVGSGATDRGGFGAFGSSDALTYFYIGPAYNSNWFELRSTGLALPATTASTSTSSGALVVSGGVGVAGAVWAGGYLSTGNHARIGAQSSVVAFSANNNVDGGLPAAWTGNYGVGVQYLGSSSNAFFIGDGSGGSTYFYTRTGSANTARLSIDNTNGNVAIGGTLQLGNAYVSGAPTATGYVVIKDSTGTSYKIPAVAL